MRLDPVPKKKPTKLVAFPKELEIYEKKVILNPSVLKSIELFLESIYEHAFDPDYKIDTDFKVRVAVAYEQVTSRMNYTLALEILFELAESYKLRYLEHFRDEDLKIFKKLHNLLESYNECKRILSES